MCLVHNFLWQKKICNTWNIALLGKWDFLPFFPQSIFTMLWSKSENCTRNRGSVWEMNNPPCKKLRCQSLWADKDISEYGKIGGWIFFCAPKDIFDQIGAWRGDNRHWTALTIFQCEDFYSDPRILFHLCIWRVPLFEIQRGLLKCMSLFLHHRSLGLQKGSIYGAGIRITKELFSSVFFITWKLWREGAFENISSSKPKSRKKKRNQRNN